MPSKVNKKTDWKNSIIHSENDSESDDTSTAKVIKADIAEFKTYLIR